MGFDYLVSCLPEMWDHQQENQTDRPDLKKNEEYLAGEHSIDEDAIVDLPIEQRIPFEVWAYGDEYGGPASLADIATELNSRGIDDAFQEQLEEYAHKDEGQIKSTIDQLVVQGILTPAGPTAWTISPSYQPPIQAQKALKKVRKMEAIRKFAKRLVKAEEFPRAPQAQQAPASKPPVPGAKPPTPFPAPKPVTQAQPAIGAKPVPPKPPATDAVFGQTKPSAEDAAGKPGKVSSDNDRSQTGYPVVGVPFNDKAEVDFHYKPPGLNDVKPGVPPAPPTKPPAMPGGPMGSLQGAGKAPNPPTGQYPPNPTPGQGPTDKPAGAVMPKLQAQGDVSRIYGPAQALERKEEDIPEERRQSSPIGRPNQSIGQPNQSIDETNRPPAQAPQTKKPDVNSVNGEDYSGAGGMHIPQAHASQTPNPQPGTPVGQPSATMPGMDRTVVGDKWQPTTQQMPGAYGTGPVATPGSTQGSPTNPANPTPQITPATPQVPAPTAQPQPPVQQQQALTPQQVTGPQAQVVDKILPTPDHQAMLDQKLGQAGFALKQPLAGGSARTYQHAVTGDWAEAKPSADGNVALNFHDRTGALKLSVDSFSGLDAQLQSYSPQQAIKNFAKTLLMIAKARKEWIGKPIGPYSNWADCKRAGKSDAECGYLYHHAGPKDGHEETAYKHKLVGGKWVPTPGEGGGPAPHGKVSRLAIKVQRDKPRVQALINSVRTAEYTGDDQTASDRVLFHIADSARLELISEHPNLTADQIDDIEIDAGRAVDNISDGVLYGDHKGYYTPLDNAYKESYDEYKDSYNRIIGEPKHAQAEKAVRSFARKLVKSQ